MRKLFLILGIVFTALAIAFAALPLDTIAFLPIGIALVLCLILLKKSEENQKKLPNILLLVCVLSSLFVVGKTLLVQDKVEQDVKFEEQKMQTKKEAKKELEDLEKDLE